MARICPDCGSFAEPETEKVRRRRVWACSNGECGAQFYRFYGRLYIRYQPWIGEVDRTTVAYNVFCFRGRR